MMKVGLDAAQESLRHNSIDVTRIYTRKNAAKQRPGTPPYFVARGGPLDVRWT